MDNTQSQTTIDNKEQALNTQLRPHSDNNQKNKRQLAITINKQQQTTTSKQTSNLQT